MFFIFEWRNSDLFFEVISVLYNIPHFIWKNAKFTFMSNMCKFMLNIKKMYIVENKNEYMYHSAILKSWWWRWLRLESVSSLNFSKTFYFLSKCLITRSILDILTSVCFVILSNKSTWYALFYNFLITDVSLKHLCY